MLPRPFTWITIASVAKASIAQQVGDVNAWKASMRRSLWRLTTRVTRAPFRTSPRRSRRRASLNWLPASPCVDRLNKFYALVEKSTSRAVNVVEITGLNDSKATLQSCMAAVCCGLAVSPGKNAGPTLRGAARSRTLQEGPSVCCGFPGKPWACAPERLCGEIIFAQHQHTVMEHVATTLGVRAAPGLRRGVHCAYAWSEEAQKLRRGVHCAGDRSVCSTSTPSRSTSRLRQGCAQHQHSVEKYIAPRRCAQHTHSVCVGSVPGPGLECLLWNVSSSTARRSARCGLESSNTVVCTRSLPAHTNCTFSPTYQISPVACGHLGHFLVCGVKEFF